MNAIKFKNGCLFYIDQTKLPEKEQWYECKNINDGYLAIKKLKVRGAPLLGVFASYCLYICGKKYSDTKSGNGFIKYIKDVARYLDSARPTAVNLSWALRRVCFKLDNCKYDKVSFLKKVVLNEAKAIHEEDKQLCASMAKYGVELVKDNDTLLTHCNAGFLATGGDGTAVAVLYESAKKRRGIKVYADETRPLLQGSRLTAWELLKRRVNVELICDNMAGYLMKQGKIDKIFVGADRVAANGDAANKIGTYSLAVNAYYHKVPFYVVAPFSTFDLKLDSGNSIPIEQRNPDEVRRIMNKVWVAPRKVSVYNPAFDVTPNKLITAIVTDKGVIKPPYRKNIRNILGI